MLPPPKKSVLEVACILSVSGAALWAVLRSEAELPGATAVRPFRAVLSWLQGFLPWPRGVLPAVTDMMELGWSAVVSLCLLGADLCEPAEELLLAGVDK